MCAQSYKVPEKTNVANELGHRLPEHDLPGLQSPLKTGPTKSTCPVQQLICKTCGQLVGTPGARDHGGSPHTLQKKRKSNEK